MNVGELVDFLNTYYPLSTQEHYDNSGLIVGDTQHDVQHVLVCLTPTEAIVREAIQSNANVILSHHPILLKGLRKLIDRTEEERIVKLCLLHNLSLISFHTPADKSFSGLNTFISQKIGLKNIQILVPEKGVLRKLVTFCPFSHVNQVREALFGAGAGVIGNYDSCSYNVEGYGTFRATDQANPFVGQKGILHQEPEVRIEVIFPATIQQKLINALLTAHPYEEVAYDIYPLENTHARMGYGAYGILDEPLTLETFINLIKKTFNVAAVRVSNNVEKFKEIQKVAVCGGSGVSFLSEATSIRADAYVTGDVKYHDFVHASQLPILLIDIGHFHSEIFFVEMMHDLLTKNFNNFAVSISKQEKNAYIYI